jgi:hypothetical protein
MKIENIFKRIVHPQDWLLEKDIHDLTIEIEMMERQLPALRRKLDELRRRKARYMN